MQTQFAVLKQQMEDPAMIDMQVEQMLAQDDPNMAMMQQES